MDVRLGILVLALAVGGTLSSPIQISGKCARRQCTASSKFTHYRPGQTYEYKYDGSVATKVNGASEGSSGLQMSAIAHIEVISDCEYALRLTDVVIGELDSEGQPRRLFGTEIFRRHLQAEPMRFSFHDGRIDDVCPTPGEKPWITNIKRGVVSSFQNSMENLQTPTKKREIDITGNCPADYRIAERGYGSITIDRSKDLLACTDRHGYKTAFQSTPYRVDSNIQSLPLTKSFHNCRQTFHNSGYLRQVECKEHHVFRPFSKENNGAITEALHKLVYQRESAGITTNRRAAFRRTNLLFEHEKEVTSASTDDATTRQVLRQTCENAANDIRPETPKLFSELVYKMKQLDTPTLRTLHQAVQRGQVCAINIEAAKKAFMDAVPMTGTVASVTLMSELIRSRQVRDKEADMWLTTLAFIQEPKLEMVQAVKDLLTTGIQNQRNYLSTTALIHNYCRHNAECQNVPAIQQIVRLLETKLNGNCRVAQSRDEDRMIMTLKALGNIGVAPGASETLGQCAAEAANSIEIRLAALDALKKQTCEATRTVALRLFGDSEQEDEIRISAYLTSMKCATADVLRQVQRVLESEKANQIGSFVWTHLTNLMETSDPHKAEIKEILSNVYLRKEFDMDLRKFSRNYEASVFLDSINTGAKMESNIIWSRKSFVPRSAMLNLTVDLFGQSVNLLEVGGRVEGIEQLLETFFGPEGYFPEKTVMNTLRREKRQVANHKLANVDRTYDAKAKLDNIKSNMYFKIFGSEMAYFDLLKLRTASDFNILDILIQLAQNREFEFNKSVMFLDTSITIPTIVGFPLKLAVNGTASINIGLSGKMDVRRAHPAPRTVDVDGKIRSSAAIQIASMMSIDANVALTGLKMVTTLHSSTEVDGKFQIQNSQIMVVNFNMPREKQEIISIDNKFFTVHQNEEKEQMMPDNERIEETRCTGDKLVKLLGVEMCGAVSYPLAGNVRKAPFYPLTGPSRIAVYLNKKDTHTAYQFEAKLLNEKTRRDGYNLYKRVARVAFNTPGSQINRNMLFDFVLDEPNKAMKVQVDTPWKNLGLEGSLVNEAAMKRATMRLYLDDQTEYSVRAEVQVDEKPQGKVFYPTVNIKLPERNPIQLTGNVAYKQPSSVSFNLRLVDLYATPVKVSGSTTYDPATTRLTTDLKLECPLIDASGEGYFEMDTENHRSRFSLKYKRPQFPEHSVTVHYKLRNTLTGSLRKMSVDTSISNTLYPEYNNKIKWELQKTTSHAETTVDLSYGHLMNDPQRRLQASVITNYQGAADRAEVDAVVSFSFPAKNIAFTTRLDHKHHQRMISSKASVAYANDQNVAVSLFLHNLSTDRLKLSSAFSFKYPGRDIVYKQTIDERQPEEYHHSLMVQWQEGRVITTKEVAKKVGHRYSVHSEINGPSMSPVYLNGVVHFPNRGLETASVIASFQTGGQRYAAQAGYHCTLGRTVDIKVNAKMEMPGRKHATGVIIYHDQARTDAGLTYEWVRNTIESLISLKVGARHTLGQNKNIAGSIELITPFRPVEKLAGRFQYTAQDEQHNANVGLTWAPEKTITLEGSGRIVDWRDFQLSGAINTPFEGYRRMASNLQCRIQNSALALAVNGQKQEERVDLELSASWNQKLSGAFKFRLPNVAHSLEGGFSHVNLGLAGRVINVNAVWDEQAVSALIKGKVNGLSDVEASVTVNTPFVGFRKSEATYKHLYQGRKAVGLIHTNFAGRQAKFLFNTENKSGYQNRDWFLMVEVMTPFRQLRIGKVTLKYAQNGDRYESQVQGMYNDMMVGYDLKMSNNYNEKLSNGQMTINTPVPGYQRLVYIWNHRFTANVLSTNEVEINGQKYTLRMNGNHVIARLSQMVRGQMTIQTPHRSLSNAVFNIKYENNANRLVTSATLAVNGNTAAVSLDATGSRRNRLVCNLNLNVESLLATYASYSLRPITASLTFNGEVRPNNLVSFVRYGNSQQIRLEGNFDYTSAQKMNGGFTVSTPIPGYERISVTMKHQYEGVRVDTEGSITWDTRRNQQIIVKGSFQHGSTFSGNLEIMTPFDLMRKFQIEYNHKHEYDNRFVHTNKVELNFMGQRIGFESGANYQGHHDVTTFAKFASPFENYRKLEYTASTKKTSRQRENRLLIELGPGRDPVDVKLTYSLRPFDMTFDIKTPFPALSSFEAKLGHANRMPYIRSEAAFDMVSYNHPMTGNVLFDMKNTNDITFRITATSDITFEVKHQKTDYLYTTKATWRMMDKTLMAETLINLEPERSSAELKIATPFPLSTLSLRSGCDRAERVYSLGYAAVYDTKNHNMDVSLALRRGTATLTLACDKIGTVDCKVSYSKIGLVHQANLEVSHNGKTVTIETGVQYEGQYMAKVNLVTPFQGYERTEFLTQLDYIPNQKVLGKFDLKTPFYLFKGLKIEYDHRGDWMNYVVKKTLECDASISRIYYTDEWKVQGNSIEGNGRLLTPFKNVEYTSYNLAHNLRGEAYETEMTVEYSPGRRAVVKNKISMSEGLQVETTITTPIEQLRNLNLNVNHRGDLKNFEQVVGVSYNTGYAVTLNAEVRQYIPISCDVRVTRPDSEPMTGTLRQSFQRNVFAHNLNIDLGNGKIVKFAANVNTNHKYEASFDLESPFEVVPMIKFHAIQSCAPVIINKVTVDVRTNQGPITLRTSFVMPNYSDVKTSFLFKSPFESMREYSLTYYHQFQSGTSLNAALSVGFAPEKVIATTLQWQKTGEMSFESKFTVTTPFEQLRSMVYTSVRSQTSKRYVSNKDSIVYNGAPLWRREWAVRGLNDISYEEDHPYFTNRFTSKKVGDIRTNKWSTIWPGEERGVRLEVTYNLQNPMIKMVVQTPHQYMNDASLTLSSRATGDYTQHGRVEIGVTHNKLSGALSGQLEWSVPERSGKLTMTTPYTEYEHLAVELKCGKQGSTHNSEVIVQYMTGKKITTKLTLTPYSAIIGVSTPFRNYEKMEMSVQYVRRSTEAYVRTQVEYNGKKIMAGVSQSVSNTRGTSQTYKAYLQTPYAPMESTTLEVTYARSLMNFDSMMKLNYLNGQEILYRVKSNAALSPKLTIEFSTLLETPYEPMRKTEFIYKHIGSMDNFNCFAEIKNYAGKSMSAALTFQRGATMTGSLTVTTPFQKWERNVLSFSHSGNTRRFVTEAKFVCATGRTTGFKVETNVQGLKRTMATVTVFSPVRGWEEMQVKLYHLMTPSGLTTSLTYGDSSNGRYQIAVEGSKFPITGTLKVTSPFGGLVMGHRGDLNGFTTAFDLTYPDNQKVNVKVEFTPNPNMLLKIESPWAQLTLTHNGQIRDFTTTAMATVSGVRTTGELRFRMYPMIFNLEFTSPKYAGKVNLNGDALDCRVLAVASCGRHNQKMELNWSLRQRIQRVAAAIKITGTKVEILAASLSHTFVNDMSTSASAQWTPTNRVAITLNYKREDERSSAELKLNTPFQNYRELRTGVYFNGNLLKFTTGADVQYRDGKRIQLAGKYEHKREGELTLKTPFRHAEDLMVKFESGMIENKAGYTITAQWTPEQALRVKVAGVINGDLRRAYLNSYLEINTPFDDLRNLVLEGIHRHSNADLATTLKAKYNHDPVFHTVFDLRFSDSKVGGYATMIRPFPVKLTADLEVNADMKKAVVEFSWDTTQPQSMIKVSGMTSRRESRGYSTRQQTISIYLPSRIMSVKNEYTKSRTETRLRSNLVWDQQRNRQIVFEAEHKDTSRSYRQKMWEAAAKLTTPVRTLQAKMSHSENGLRYVSDGELSWDLLRAPEKKVGIVSISEITERNCKTDITLKAPGTNDIKLSHEAKYLQDEIIFWSKSSLSYSPRAQDTITLIQDVRDTLVGSHHNYSASVSIEHPTNKIQITALGHYGASYRSKTAGMKLAYMKATGQVSEIHALGEIDTEYNRGKLMLSTPLRRVDLLGRLTQDRYGYKVDQETIFNGERTWWSLDLNQRNASLDFQLHYDHAQPTKAFMVRGWYLPKEAVLEALHEDSSNTEVLGLASVKLNSSRVLLTRFHWKPSLLQQIKEESVARAAEINNALVAEYNTVKSALNAEAERRRQMLLTPPDMSLMNNAIAQEAQSFRDDYQFTMRTLEDMLDNNEFFMQSIADAATRAGKVIGDRTRMLHWQVRRALQDFVRSMKLNLATIRRRMDQVMAKLEERIAAVVLKFRPAWQTYAYQMIRGVQNTQQTIAHGWERLREGVQENNVAFARFFDDHFDFISYKLEPFWEQWSAMSDNLFSPEERTFFATLKEKLDRWAAKVQVHFETCWRRCHDKLLIYRDVAQAEIDRVVAKMMEYHGTRVLLNYGKQIYYHMVDAWEAWEVPETLTRVANSLYKETKAYLQEYAARFMKQYMRVENSGFTTYDPENGEIRFALFLPLEIKQFDQMPKIDLEAAKLALQQLKERYMPQGDYSFWDTYYKYKPSSNPRDWIPPFEAHAMLAHGKHYTTFDGVHYDFASAGTCSYVLARDFIDGNFTVVANYRSGRIHSIMVMSNGKNIEIFEDFKVTVDDHRKELPVEFDNTTVTRVGHSIRVHNEKGVTVRCDLYNKICTTNVTGWYYGKTAGLFGTFNNEQDDEFLTTSRRTTDDLNEFTQSWEIGHECPGSRNAVRQLVQTTNPEIRTICESYFKKADSTFRPCFRQVEPKAFLDMCISDLQQDFNRRSLREKACDVSAIYRAQCEIAGVNLEQDSQCIKCSRPDQGSYQGSITIHEQRVKKADIVLIVEEKPCNRDVVNRLESIVNIIDNSLKAKGIRDSSFTIMGFGGRGVHDRVHTHTMEGQLFNQARKVRAAIRTLDFSGDGENKDVLGAVYESTKLSFRTGASKSIVLIPCSDCDAKTIDYAALQQILTENTINMHVMAEHDFTLRVNSPKTNYLFGIDNSAAYTMYHVNQRDLRGDVHLHRQVVVPKTLCGALALSQNGSIFNVQKLTEGRSKTQKSFVDIFARRVAKSAVPLNCQVCDCVQDEDGVGKSLCRSCEMPTYNSFFKKFFPTMYQYAPTEAFSGSDKAEQIPLPIPAPRQRHLQYEEADRA